MTEDTMTRELADIMANDVLEEEGFSSFYAGPDAEWVAYASNEEENVVVFACNGTVCEFDFEDKEDLANIIYDFFLGI